MFEKFFRGSWKTSLSAFALAVCGGTGIADEISPFLPEKVRLSMHAFCLLSVVFGLISAKDFNKTNAMVATVETQTLPMKTPQEPALVVARQTTR